MDVIPVLDIMNGVVVRGIAGQRSKYRPVQSLLTPSRDPSVILNVIRSRFGLNFFYVADLDAIQFARPNRCTIAELARDDVGLIVDSGVRNLQDVEDLLDLGVTQVVVALETLPNEETAAQLITSFGSDSLVFSLDLKSGVPLTAHQQWKTRSPQELAQQFVEIGFRNMIVLDLASVGTSEGMPTLALCRQLRNQISCDRLITGGGVSGPDDLCRAADSLVDGILVASALHDDRLLPDDLLPYSAS